MRVRSIRNAVLFEYCGFFWEPSVTAVLTLSPGLGSMNVHAVGLGGVSVAGGPCQREGSSATDLGCVEAKSDNLSVMLEAQSTNRFGATPLGFWQSREVGEWIGDQPLHAMQLMIREPLR